MWAAIRRRDHTTGIDARDAAGGHDFDAAGGQGLFDHRARSRPEIRADGGRLFEQDGAHPRLPAEAVAQPSWHVAGRLDAGETAAHDHDRVPRRARGAGGQGRQVRLQGLRAGQLVDIEGVLGEAGDRRSEQATAGGQHEAIIGQARLASGGVPHHHSPLHGVDLMRRSHSGERHRRR